MRTAVLMIPLLLIAIPSASKQKKPTGEINDPAAFAKVASYCVDASELSPPEAYDVRGFVAVEGKPGKLLSKLSWKLLPGCQESDPDAIIKLEFPRMRVYSITPAAPPGATAPDDQMPEFFHIVAILRVLGAGSSHLLYQVQADPLATGSQENEAEPVLRRNAIYGAFWKLSQDVRFVSQNQSSHREQQCRGRSTLDSRSSTVDCLFRSGRAGLGVTWNFFT